ncbi:MAG TPA: hypothetical protein PLZ43_13705 [bacterium]|nr:hypothetical protein [bacterium]
MKVSKFTIFFVNLFLICTFAGCSPSVKPPSFENESTKSDIVGSKGVTGSAIDIDIYIDATTSMKGFALVPGNAYSKFLDELESAIHTSWKESNIKFFKFGTKIREMTREEYKSSEDNDVFYREKGILEQTNIDQVVDQTSQDRISLVVTDLFQTDGDVLKVVDKLKERCFGKDIDLAIMGIKSDYNGIIFDTKVPPFPLNTQGNPDLKRAFYAIIFGNGPNIEHLFKTLMATPLKEYISEKQFTIISSKAAVRDFNIEILKPEGSKKDRSIVIKKKLENSKDPLTYHATVTDSSNPMPILVKLNLNSGYYPSVGDLVVRVDKMAVIKGSKAPVVEENTSDFKIKNISRNGDTVTVEFELNYPPKASVALYAFYFGVSQLNAFLTPDWIKAFSTENPTPESEPNKTLNLDRFVRDLLRATASVNDYKVAKGYLHITVK